MELNERGARRDHSTKRQSGNAGKTAKVAGESIDSSLRSGETEAGKDGRASGEGEGINVPWWWTGPQVAIFCHCEDVGPQQKRGASGVAPAYVVRVCMLPG